MPDPQNRKEEKKSFLVVSCIVIKVVQYTMCNTQCMSKMSKILKCTCINFRSQSRAHHSWFELGAEVRLDIVDDEEVEV